MVEFDPKKIRELRKDLGLNQADFAWRIRKSRQIVNCWENGVSKPTIKSLLSMANTFGRDVGFFFVSK